MSQQLDAYERQHMHPDEGLLYREKAPRPRWWNPVFLGVAAFLASANLYDPVNGWHALAVGLPPLAAAWLILPILRIAVTKKNVRIQMGVVGPTIPVDQVVSCELIDMSRGAEGRPRGFLYSVGGDRHRVVHIRWRNKGNKTLSTLVSVNRPDQLMAAIEKARAAASTSVSTEDALAQVRAAQGVAVVAGQALFPEGDNPATEETQTEEQAAGSGARTIAE